jgi:hypothetical protein
LPAKLAFTALGLTALGACSGQTSAPAPTSDAASDSPAPLADATTTDAAGDDGAPVPGADAQADVAVAETGADAACDAEIYCGPSAGTDAAACPGLICDLSMCPTGCEPFV